MIAQSENGGGNENGRAVSTESGVVHINSFSAKKQRTKLTSAKNLDNCFIQLYHIDNSKTKNSVDSDEAAHDESPYQDPRCLLIKLFLSLALKVLCAKSLFKL